MTFETEVPELTIVMSTKRLEENRNKAEFIQIASPTVGKTNSRCTLSEMNAVWYGSSATCQIASLDLER